MKSLLFFKTLLVLFSMTESVKQKSLFNLKKNFTLVSNSDSVSLQDKSNRCGISNRIGSAQRILGGRLAHNGEFPWIISLYKNGRFSCGGSIINVKSIVTAAHCVQSSLASDLKIRYNSISRSEGGLEMNVSKITIHPNYDNQTIDNDIAILHLKNNLVLDQMNARHICLPSKEHIISAGDIMTTIGWGLTDSHKNTHILRAIDIPMVSLSTCRSQYKLLPNLFKITDNMICAGLKNGGEDACSGDSGGPMIKSFNGSVSVLIGIVSKGFGCALPNKAGVYTRVVNYVDWIQQNII